MKIRRYLILDLSSTWSHSMLLTKGSWGQEPVLTGSIHSSFTCVRNVCVWSRWFAFSAAAVNRLSKSTSVFAIQKRKGTYIAVNNTLPPFCAWLWIAVSDPGLSIGCHNPRKCEGGGRLPRILPRFQKCLMEWKENPRGPNLQSPIPLRRRRRSPLPPPLSHLGRNILLSFIRTWMFFCLRVTNWDTFNNISSSESLTTFLYDHNSFLFVTSPKLCLLFFIYHLSHKVRLKLGHLKLIHSKFEGKKIG